MGVVKKKAAIPGSLVMYKALLDFKTIVDVAVSICRTYVVHRQTKQ